METFKKCQKAVGTPRDKAAKRMEIKARKAGAITSGPDTDIPKTENTVESGGEVDSSAGV